jgi:MFS family permease
MRVNFNGLWQHADFKKLWAGETISHFGTQITALALPLTAVLVLKATPLQMGILVALEFAPFLLLSLFAGVWVDRLPRRPILIVGDFGRAAVLLLVPLAAFTGILTMEILYIVGVLVGILTVFFDVAYQSYLPALVERKQLTEGNSKLEVSRSVAQISGPGLAGALVQILTAPVAILLDALSFVVSGLFITAIKKKEDTPKASSEKKNIWREIGEGLNVVFGSRYLRSIAGCTGTSNLFSNIAGAVLTIFLARELALNPVLIGVYFGVGSVGGLLGALLANRVAEKFGVGNTIVYSMLLSGTATLIVPFVNGPTWLIMGMLIVSFAIVAFSIPVYNIAQVSLRQAITPMRLQGRMNASMRFLVWGTMPIGSIIGGFLGELIGIRATLLVAGVGGTLAFLWVFFSPVRQLREQPEPVDDAPAPVPQDAKPVEVEAVN